MDGVKLLGFSTKLLVLDENIRPIMLYFACRNPEVSIDFVET